MSTPEIASELATWGEAFGHAAETALPGPAGEAVSIAARLLAWGARIAASGQDPAALVERLADTERPRALVEDDWRAQIDAKAK